MQKATRGTETSKYPEEEKETSISQVAASERERAQTEDFSFRGCGPLKGHKLPSRTHWEVWTKRVKSP